MCELLFTLNLPESDGGGSAQCVTFKIFTMSKITEKLVRLQEAKRPFRTKVWKEIAANPTEFWQDFRQLHYTEEQNWEKLLPQIFAKISTLSAPDTEEFQLAA